MAFSKIGNLLRQTISTHVKSEFSASSPSVFQAIRCMSSSKLFIGGLSYSTDDQSLREAFSSYGEVIEARVINDRETGRSRGFGFVTFTSTEEANAAKTGMDGKDLHGRMLRVDYAADRSGGFRGGYGGGGYGGGGGGYGAGAGGYGAGGGGNYGSGGYGDNSGNYGAGNYTGGGSNNYGGGYGSGGGAGYGAGFGEGSGGNYGVAGGGGGSDNYAAASGGGSGYGSGGSSGNFGGSGGVGYGSNEQSFPSSQGGMNESFDGNFRDDADEPDGYANRRA